MAEVVAFNFEAQLRIEVGRILDDLIFVRSPSQTKLLKFLLEATLSNAPPPTQYEIAVDALGRSPDYDVTSDSYPRVQISRLRKSLTNYYERNLPAYGMRVMLDTGLYQLSLEPVEEHGGAADESEYADAEPAMIAEPVAKTVPEAAPIIEQPEMIEALAQPLVKERDSYLKLAFVSLGIIAGLVLGAWFFPIGAPDTSVGAAPTTLRKPLVAIVIKDDGLLGDSAEHEAAVAGARQVARRQLMNSFVSRLSVDEIPHGQPDYILEMDFRSTGDRQADVLVSLIDRASEALYTDTKPLNFNDQEDFVTSLEGSLIYMTAPTGIIASQELVKINDAMESPFACFLSIESMRSHGEATGPMVNACLTEFPNSEFSPFWLARRSFEGYQGRIASSGQVSRSGQEWEDLQAALERDRFNAFASFVAAKVELSQGNCIAAQAFIRRALGRGSSYPILISAMEAEASACQISDILELRSVERIQAIFAQNPNPDPLLHVYLMVAAVAADEMDLAETIAQRGVIDEPSGPIETAAALLSKQLVSKNLTKAERSQLINLMQRFLWNKETRDLVKLRVLDKEAGYWDSPATPVLAKRQRADLHS